jgi:hypothetical protein
MPYTVLMARRTSYGICELCGKRASKAAMARHLASCVAEHDRSQGKPQRLLHLRVQDAYTPLYWLDVEIGAQRSLRDLDRFLRDIWLECCGHLSAFEIDGVHYSAAPDHGWREECGMGARIGEVLSPEMAFRHEYDFGSTTELAGRVLGEREGRIGRMSLRLLARNEAPAWSCAVCGVPATVIDTQAMYESENPFYCATHAAELEDDWALLPVVNSPRMGVCGYHG